MFKSSGQTRAKSPYQPKLLQSLIDSSDEQNLSMSSGDNIDEDFNQQEKSYDHHEGRKSQFINLYNNDDKRSVKSVYTSLSQQTVKVQQSADFNQTKHPKNTNPTQSNLPKPQTLNLTRFTQSKQIKPAPDYQNLFNPISQKTKFSHSPNLAIKYDTLKLSEYDSKELKKQELLYQQNIKEFRQKFNTSKPQEKQNKNEEIFIQQQKQEIDDYMDSLEAMKRSNLNRRHFSRKSLKNQISTPSSRIKFVQQQREPNENEKDQIITELDVNLQIERLRQQLKRSKDIIKTLSLKNADLQKSLQMKNTKLMEFESEQNSIMTEIKSQKQRKNAQKKVYYQINLYIKERVKDFVNEIMTIKMSPLLQQVLQNFLQQILQLNKIIVQKKVGDSEIEPEDRQPRQPLKEVNENTTPNRLSKSIFNTKSEIGQKQDPSKVYSSTSNHFRNNFQATHPESHIKIGTNRQNVFISSKSDKPGESNFKGVSVKVNLTSNKENITPNKRVNGDQELRQLEKSLQKLKAMEKQLQTPVPKTQFMTNKSNFVSNNDDYRTEYSIINRSHLSGFGKEENSAMNLSSNNLDRSKSRRKKIFAQTNHK